MVKVFFIDYFDFGLGVGLVLRLGLVNWSFTLIRLKLSLFQETWRNQLPITLRWLVEAATRKEMFF